MLAGFELEWMVLSTDASGAEQPAVIGGPYGADRLVDGLDYATAVLQALDAAQLPLLQFHPEFGAGQFELSLAPGSVLEAADRVVICGAGGTGTASEAAHSIKAGKPLFLLQTPAPSTQFFQSLDAHVRVFAEVDLLLIALDQAVAELSPPASANDPATQP